MTAKIPPPERRRRVDHYSADELHAMLVDDLVRFRPAGGPGMKGLRWMKDACERIGKLTGHGADAAWLAVLDDLEARTGRKMAPLG